MSQPVQAKLREQIVVCSVCYLHMAIGTGLVHSLHSDSRDKSIVVEVHVWGNFSQDSSAVFNGLRMYTCLTPRMWSCSSLMLNDLRGVAGSTILFATLLMPIPQCLSWGCCYASSCCNNYITTPTVGVSRRPVKGLRCLICYLEPESGICICIGPDTLK